MSALITNPLSSGVSTTDKAAAVVRGCERGRHILVFPTGPGALLHWRRTILTVCSIWYMLEPERSARGAVTRDAVVGASEQLLEREGRLSLRRVAAALDASPAALYHHVLHLR